MVKICAGHKALFSRNKLIPLCEYIFMVIYFNALELYKITSLSLGSVLFVTSILNKITFRGLFIKISKKKKIGPVLLPKMESCKIEKLKIVLTFTMFLYSGPNDKVKLQKKTANH